MSKNSKPRLRPRTGGAVAGVRPSPDAVVARKKGSRLRWDDLQTVLAVARGGTLSAAARTLDLEHSTVYRRLNELEVRLGSRAFERLPEGYVPTTQGEALIRAAEAMETAVLTAERAIVGADATPTGNVRLATSELLAGALLPQLWPALLRDLPGLQVEVTASNTNVDLTRREADLALRATNDPPPHLVGRAVATVGYAVFAASGVTGEARLDSTADLSGHRWLGFDEKIATFPNARWLREQHPEIVPVLLFDSTLAMSRAAALGAGLAVLPIFAGRAESGLVQLCEPLPTARMSLWVLRHAEVAQNARVRALATWLMEHVGEVMGMANGGKL